MEPKIQSSFIPKKPISSSEKILKPQSKPMGLIFLISLVLFLSSAGAAVGLFAYRFFLEDSVEEKSATLESARATFAPAQIQTLRRLDLHINTARSLLDRHLRPSSVFSVLERVTLKNVKFNDLTYTLLPDGNPTIQINGTARSFASVALQSDTLRKEALIRNPTFSELNFDEDGNATFNFDALLNTDILKYSVANGQTSVVLQEVLEEENGDEVLESGPEEGDELIE